MLANGRKEARVDNKSLKNEAKKNPAGVGETSGVRREETRLIADGIRISDINYYVPNRVKFQ